jgi:LmbE family N-acetylglucosaminyl deacetylase
MWNFKDCALIVAHPDDETLWAGGTVLINSESNWEIISLCRKSDANRRPKFFRAIKELDAVGDIGDLEDGVEQTPLEMREVEKIVIKLLRKRKYDLIVTHSVRGEYARHKRHEETSNAVLSLFEKEKLKAHELWMFAYEDGGGKYYPRPINEADTLIILPEKIWDKKFKIIRDIYGFSSESWEAKTAPKKEAFWCFKSSSGVREKFISRSYEL